VIDSTEGRFGEGGASRRRRKEGSAPALAMPQPADRLPPHSIEAEQGVFGCVLLSPNECMGVEHREAQARERSFYDMRHQALFDVLAEMYDKKELIDPIMVQQYLRDRNQLEALGGMPYIAGLMNCVPSAANLEYYIEIVREKYVLRKMIQTCTGAWPGLRSSRRSGWIAR
jgi:replicative DNA helicase